MVAASAVPSAAWPARRSVATMRTASAVELAGRIVAWGSSLRRNRAHWPGTCGWERIVSISESASSRAAISEWRTRSSHSPTICTSGAASASRSSVTLTDPSSEFSIGAIAQSTSPSRSALTVSKIVARATGCTASASALASRASSVNVPSGPR